MIPTIPSFWKNVPTNFGFDDLDTSYLKFFLTITGYDKEVLISEMTPKLIDTLQKECDKTIARKAYREELLMQYPELAHPIEIPHGHRRLILKLATYFKKKLSIACDNISPITALKQNILKRLKKVILYIV